MAWIVHIEGKRGQGTPCTEHARYCRYKAGYRDPERRVRYKTFDRKRDADVFLAKTETAKNEGTYTDPARGRVPFGEFMDHVLATSPNLAPTTRARYETHGRLYLRPAFGSRALNTVTREDVKRFVADLVGRGVGVPTIEAAHGLLHRIFAVAVDEDRITKNPASKVELPELIGHKARFLTEREVAAIAREVPDRYSTLVLFLAYSGVRIGEASALRVHHLDLTGGTVRVEESSAEVGGRKITGPTKNRKNRTVYMPATLVEALARHLGRFGNPKDPDSLVFTGSEGGPIRQNNFRKRVFQPAAARVGISPIPHVHDLRHTAASLMGKAGYSMADAMEMLGHSVARMTAMYTHWFPEERQAKAKRLDELMVAAASEGTVRQLA